MQTKWYVLSILVPVMFALTIIDLHIPTIAELLQRESMRPTAFTAAYTAASMLAARIGLNGAFQNTSDDLSDPQIGADRWQRSRNGRCIADLSIQ